MEKQIEKNVDLFRPAPSPPQKIIKINNDEYALNCIALKCSDITKFKFD